MDLDIQPSFRCCQSKISVFLNVLWFVYWYISAGFVTRKKKSLSDSCFVWSYERNNRMFSISSHALRGRKPEAALLDDACGEYPSNRANYWNFDVHRRNCWPHGANTPPRSSKKNIYYPMSTQPDRRLLPASPFLTLCESSSLRWRSHWSPRLRLATRALIILSVQTTASDAFMPTATLAVFSH